MSGQALEGWSSTRQQRGRLPDGGSGLPPAACHYPTEGSLSSSQKAVGGFIPPDAGTYRAGQGKGSHGADTGLSGESISLSGKVLFWVALRLPYLLGTLCHHEEAGLPDGEQQHRAAGRLPPDTTEGSLSTHRKP